MTGNIFGAPPVNHNVGPPDNLRSLIIWMSRHANPEPKRDMLRHALYEVADYIH